MNFNYKNSRNRNKSRYQIVLFQQKQQKDRESVLNKSSDKKRGLITEQSENLVATSEWKIVVKSFKNKF